MAHQSIPPLNEAHPITAESLKIPRLYQKELLEEAKQRNIIIRADTGSGKTLVACELIIWTALQPKPTNDHQIQVFLVPTRPLVHQQAKFIQSHSSLRVKAYAGDIQPELWRVDKWHSELEQVDVLVSTAKIFYDLISKGYWKFENVSLLIFDEAHHCRKNHIYNQIMRSQYHRLAQDPKQRLPKILGMTASPIWDFKTLQQAEKDIRILQSALAARLCEVKMQVEDISNYNFKPNESTIYYESPPPFKPLTHAPWDQVHQLISMYADDRVVSNLKSVYSELGIYAYMLLVASWLKSLVTLDNPKQLSSSRLLDSGHQKHINQIIELINQALITEDVPENQLASKIVTLNKILIDYMENDDQREFQCIIFIDRRLHAQLLPTLLERNARLKNFIRPVALAGHGNNHTDCISFNMNSKAQHDTVQKLHTGASNLVVATNVAEEGLDFQTCNLVIRLDEITSWKGYIQSRGRARARNSDYIVMLPAGSEPKFSKYIAKEEELRALVYDRPKNELIEDGEVESMPQLICQLPNGNHSILTYNAATSLLNAVCQLQPSDEFLPTSMPEYEFLESGGNYECKLTLPPMTALLPSQRTFLGEPMPTKKDAKRAAAFAACKILRELGVLNEHFLPNREDKSSRAQDANGRKIEDIALPDTIEAIVPNVYGNLWTSSEIWIHKLSFPDDSPSGSSSMGLLCERRLRIPDGLRLFNHFDKSKPLVINFDYIHKIEWDKGDVPTNLKKLERFTRVVLQGAVNRRAYEGKLFFLVAPFLKETTEIDWSLVENPLVPLSSIEDFSNYPCIVAPLRQLHTRIIDKYELCTDLSDSSPPNLLPTCPKMRDFLKKSKKFSTLGHFYKVVYSLEDVQYEEQPLIYLEATFEPTNNLSQLVPTPAEPAKILLPLSTCRGTHIPRSDWKMFSFIPSLTRILYDGGQVMTLLDNLNVIGTQALLAIKALTPPGVGVPWDYQTLETVGDAFLKLATSVHIYLIHLRKGEGDMSLLRSRSVDNVYLRGKAIQANLPSYILSQSFRIDKFRDAQTENGKALACGNFLRKIPKRVLSDVVEALLGAGFLSGGVELGLKFGMALDLCFGGTTPWNQRDLDLSLGKISPDMVPPSTISKYEQVEREINYVFKNKLLLVQALTHRSANSFITNCYEREEWLGDAVIDMWIVDRAYHRFHNATAEQLSLTRAKVVSNGSLGFLAIKKLGLQNVIIHNSDALNESLKEAVEAIKPFQKIGNYYSNIDNLFVVFEPPKILNDVFESIVGAVFVDSGFNLKIAYQTLDLIFEQVIPELSQLVAHDPLSRLLKIRNKYQCSGLERESALVQIPNPEDQNQPPISARVCRIMLHGQEVAVGRHSESFSVAEQRGALEALKVLADDNLTTDNGTILSLLSNCPCKSKTVTINQQPPAKVSNELDDPSGKKNKKKRAKLAQLQAQDSLVNSNSMSNDSVDFDDVSINAAEGNSADKKYDHSNIIQEDTINNHKDGFVDNQDDVELREDDSIDSVEEASINSTNVDSDNIIKKGSIENEDDSTNIIKKSFIENEEDDPIEIKEDDCIDNSDLKKYDSIQTIKDDSIDNPEDDCINTHKDCSINDEVNVSISSCKDRSFNSQGDVSINKQDDVSMGNAARDDCIDMLEDCIVHSGDEPKKDKDHPLKNQKERRLKENREIRLNNQMNAAKMSQTTTSKANSSSQVDGAIIQQKKVDNVVPSKGQSSRGKSKLTNIENDDVVEIKPIQGKSKLKNIASDDVAEIIPAQFDGYKKKKSDEDIIPVEIIEIPGDSNPAPAQHKRKRRKDKNYGKSCQSNAKTSWVVQPISDDDEIIIIKNPKK